MIKAKTKGFEVQSIHKCINYNWSKDKNKHCAVYFSESDEKPVNAYIEYFPCCLDNGEICRHYKEGKKYETNIKK